MASATQPTRTGGPQVRTMRAFAVERFGEAPAVHELPIPAVDGAVLVRVAYAGVNPVDYKLIDRLTAQSIFPVVVGLDFAGVVEQVGEGERDFRPGDRVFGMSPTHGSYAQYTALVRGGKPATAARIPDGITHDQAAALPVAGITALGSLELLAVRAGERLVVTGASGAVGGYAVQMARARGVHVIATVRGDADEALRLGAEEVYDTNVTDVFAAIHSAHPDGVDAMLDVVDGGDTIRRVAEILKPGGRLVSTLYAADKDWFAGRHITAYNVASNTNHLSSAEGLTQLARMLADGTITTRVTTVVDLDGAGQLLEKLRRGGVQGKALVRL